LDVDSLPRIICVTDGLSVSKLRKANRLEVEESEKKTIHRTAHPPSRIFCIRILNVDGN
jgi:hypothetical protein